MAVKGHENYNRNTQKKEKKMSLHLQICVYSSCVWICVRLYEFALEGYACVCVCVWLFVWFCVLIYDYNAMMANIFALDFVAYF